MTWETSIYGNLNREDYEKKARFAGLGDFFDIHDKIPILFGIGSPYILYTLRAHHQECIFHMQMRPQKRALVAAPFEHKLTDSQTILHYRTVRNPIATDYVWEGMWLENRQGV